MIILFVHQNFPAQFTHLAPALAARGHRVLALTDEGNSRTLRGVETFRYARPQHSFATGTARLGRTYAEMAERGLMAMRAARALRDRHGVQPDVVFGHIGWGETLFLRDIWPGARHLAYAEYHYAPRGLDTGFDPEFPPAGDEPAAVTMARAAHLTQAMAMSCAAVAPTRFQAATFPPVFRPRIAVIHDGIDTDTIRPDPQARLALPSGQVLRAGDEVLSFVNRNLEPYRGAHVFLRALPRILAQRPGAQVVVVGGDGVSYGQPAPGGRSWREVLLAELQGRIDLERVHFTGRLARGDFLSLLQVTRVHAYLTYPFVLSWSLIEAMAAGAHVVASRTPPVEEVIAQGVEGDLVEFFDVPGWSASLIRALADPAAHEPQRRAARARAVAGFDLRRVCLPRLVKFVEDAPMGMQGASDPDAAGSPPG